MGGGSLHARGEQSADESGEAGHGPIVPRGYLQDRGDTSVSLARVEVRGTPPAAGRLRARPPTPRPIPGRRNHMHIDPDAAEPIDDFVVVEDGDTC